MRLIDRLRDRGFTLKLEGWNLLVEPSAKISDELAAWIVEKKAQMILELQIEADEEYEANVRYCEGRIGFPPDELMGADYLEWLGRNP